MILFKWLFLKFKVDIFMYMYNICDVLFLRCYVYVFCGVFLVVKWKMILFLFFINIVNTFMFIKCCFYVVIFYVLGNKNKNQKEMK